MNKSEHQKYLSTPHWKRTKTLALSKRGKKCEACYATERLHVHHRTYERRGAERLTDLRVLCETCHSMVHKLERQGMTLVEATNAVMTARNKPKQRRGRGRRPKPARPSPPDRAGKQGTPMDKFFEAVEQRREAGEGWR